MVRNVLSLFVLMLATPAVATKIQVVNLCEGSMQLYVGSHGPPTAIREGAIYSLELEDGTNAAYRYGASYQATQAEFANVDSRTWVDISIIPSGNTGAGSCSSLEDCKAVTGGTGFNMAMQIIPSSGGGTSSSETCRVLSCLEDGCEDAYQFPDQDARTHSCSADIEFQVIFCPDNSTVSTSDSAADYWVDASNATASESNSTSDSGRSDASESMDDDTAQIESQSETTDAPSNSNKKTTVNTTSGDSSGTSTAVYVAAGVVASVVALVAATIAFKRRHAIAFWWETRNYKGQDACSSDDELGFMRISDDAII